MLLDLRSVLEGSRFPASVSDALGVSSYLPAVTKATNLDIAFRSNSSDDVANPGTSLVISLPSGVQATDVVIVIIGQRNSAGSAMSATAPSGWTSIHAGQSKTNLTEVARVDGFWALGNVSNLSFTLNGNETSAGWVCLAFQNVDNTTPIDATGTTNAVNNATSITANAVTTVTDRSLELIGCADYNLGQLTATGFTKIENGAANATACCLYANAVTTPAGSTGTQAVSDNASGTSQILVAMPFALRRSASASSSITTWSRLPSDNLAFADLLTAVIPQARLLLDSIGVGDSLVAVLAQSRVISDNLALSDNAARYVQSFRILSDALGISDSVAAGIAGLGTTWTRLITDLLALADVEFASRFGPTLPQIPLLPVDPRFALTGYSNARGLLYGFPAIARKWTFTVSGVANNHCTACASFNGLQTITYDNRYWTWHSGQSACYGDAFGWRMYGLFWPVAPVMHLEMMQVAYPSGSCYPSPQQQDAWEIPVSQFNPVGTNVLPHVTTDSRSCRDCDATAVGSITITPVFS